MSGDIFESESFFTRSTKTSAQIISEAKASMCDQDVASLRRPSQAKLVTTSRPFTPKQKERQLYRTRARFQRPSSSIHLSNCIIEEDYGVQDDRPPSTLGVRLVPLKTPTRSVSVDSIMGIGPLPSIKDPKTSPPPLTPLKLPSIGSASHFSMRHQFRRPLEAVTEAVATGSNSLGKEMVQPSPSRLKSSPRHSIATIQSPTTPPQESDEFTIALDDLKQSQGDEEVVANLENLIRMLETAQVKSFHRKSLMQALSRHLTSENVLIMFGLVDVMLVTRVTRNNFTLASKVLFKLARDDSNDHQFETRKTLELFLLALSRGCPRSDSEAFVYGYGALKFLTLNNKLVRSLESLGFIQLSMIHLKLLCDPSTGGSGNGNGTINENETSNVLFQITSSLRNMLTSNRSKDDFSSTDGTSILEKLVAGFNSDVDVACNVARIMSVLSADDDICEKYFDNPNFINSLFCLLKAHTSRRDVVVRVTFCMGNIAAKCDESRLHLAKHSDIDVLSGLLFTYAEQLRNGSLEMTKSEDFENVDFGGSSGTVEDTCVKVIRVIANASIHPEAGSALALSELTVDSLLQVGEVAAITAQDELLLPTLAALNNLSFYSIVRQRATYAALKSFLRHSNVQVIAETARVFGNLSRRTDIRLCLSQDGAFSVIVDLLESEDRDLVYACVGILVNLMSDPQHRPLFKAASGVRKSILVLEFCAEREDWALASLVCQVIWNYSIDSKFGMTMDEDTVRLLEDVLVYLLEICNESAAKKAADYQDNMLQLFQGEEREFCKVGLGLLKRIMDDCPRQIELLLDDD